MIDSKVPKNLTDLVFAGMGRPRVGNEWHSRLLLVLAEEFCRARSSYRLTLLSFSDTLKPPQSRADFLFGSLALSRFSVPKTYSRYELWSLSVRAGRHRFVVK